MRGKLYIVCAPSGAGKTSLVRALLQADANVSLSISYTTRAPRPGEIDGKDYHFVSNDVFKRMLEAGEFLESANVHGNHYGTSQAWINQAMLAGKDILLEIDWQGAEQVRKLVPTTVGIFILPPSLGALEQRLTDRAQDSKEIIAKRLNAAREEISHANEFDYVIINHQFDDAVKDLVSIVRAERLKTDLQLERHQTLVNQLK
jgi:guanylate kinase